ncbi:unnamed protein product [Lymnaea stagnalis]|uniref:G-protein coupled receptors family 1 profile domain-containing protein n=1 Tax=Lymnaea stagnalis TaxID=6523 RepID=A0AAV2HZ57_LYMST
MPPDVHANGSNASMIYTDTTNPRLVNGVVVLLLLILNLLGNGLVFYVYKFRVKKTIFSLFVTILAVLDLLSAVTTMLMDVIVKVRPLDEKDMSLAALCKLTHFQVYANHLISGCVLTLIAYQRYRKICRPLKPGMTKKTAKIVLVITGAVCILLSLCTLVINGPQVVQIKIRSFVVNTTICRYDKEYEGKLLQQAFSYLLLLAFVLVLTLTVTFYVMVSRALQSFERRNSTISAAASPDVDSANKEFQYGENSDRHRHEYLETRASVFSVTSGGDRISVHMYKMFTIVTGIFVLSYLPHLVVLILLKAMRLDHRVLTYTQRVLLELAYNCPYISTIANPVVYGFRSAEFREHCRHLLTCRRWRQRRAYLR